MNIMSILNGAVLASFRGRAAITTVLTRADARWRVLLGLSLLPLVLWIGLAQTAPYWTLTLDPARIQAASGQMYQYNLTPANGVIYALRGDSLQFSAVSELRLFEDGRPFGLPHQLHASISQTGGGAYSHWGRYLLFSTLDGSDPRYSGRHYVVSAPASVRPWLVVTLVISSVLLVLPALRRAVLRHGLERVGSVAAFAILAVALLAVPGHVLTLSGGAPLLAPDSGSYLDLNLMRTPGYYLFLRLLTLVGDVGSLVVPVQLGLVVAGLLGLAAGLAVAVGRPLVGTVTAVLLVADLGLLGLTLNVLTEALFLALLCAHLGLLLALLRRDHWGLALLAGLALGGLMIVRPVGYCLLPGVVFAALLLGWRRGLRRLGLILTPVVVIVGASIIANQMMFGVAVPHTLTGYALFGHVAHLISPADAAVDPDLAAIRQRILPQIEEVSHAAFPEGYYQTQTNTINTMLWLNAAPYMAEKYDVKNASSPDDFVRKIIFINRELERLSKYIIAAHPVDYARLICAQTYGMWKIVFYPTWSSSALPYYYKSSADLQIGSNEIAAAIMAKAHAADPVALEQRAQGTSPIEVVSATIGDLFRAVRWGLALAMLVAIVLALRPGSGPGLRVLGLLSVEVWCYVGAVAASTPAISRYAAVAEPGLIAFAVAAAGVAWGAVAARSRP